MKNNRLKRILSVAIVACSCFLAGCGNKIPTYKIHTEKQSEYLSGEYGFYMKYATGKEELGRPEPIKIDLSKKYENSDRFFLSEKEDMSDAREYEIGKDGTVTLYNLKIATTYFYSLKNETQEKMQASFKTEDMAPRNLYIDGVTNVRDIGGWKNDSGVPVKQGMLFRSAKFNADESTEILISEEGIQTLTEELGIKTEIDLRTSDDNENGGITHSVLGDNVSYIQIPFVSGGNIVLLNKDKIKAIFTILGNEENYPIVFHCSIGTDRTGMIAFLINSLLGVSEEDLYKDFLFSNFGDIGRMRAPSIIETYMDTVRMNKAATLKENTEEYLISIGVDREDIDALRRILSDD